MARSRYEKSDSESEESEVSVSTRSVSDDESKLSSADENMSPAQPFNKEESRICKSFAIGLIDQALSHGFEMEEIGKLVNLIVQELGLVSPKKVVSLLSRMTVGGNPVMLSSLVDAGVQLSADQIISLLFDFASKNHSLDTQVTEDDNEDSDSNIQHRSFIGAVQIACEMGLFDVNDEKIMYILWEYASDFSDSERKHLCRICCGHASSKRSAAKIISAFIAGYSTNVCAKFICEMITFESFLDIRGKMSHFWSALQDLEKPVKDYLINDMGLTLNKDGEIQESDVDEEGNLEGFIQDDDESISVEGGGSESEALDSEEVDEDESNNQLAKQYNAAVKRHKSEQSHAEKHGLDEDASESSEENDDDGSVEESEEETETDDDDDSEDIQETPNMSTKKHRLKESEANPRMKAQKRVIEDTDSD